MRLGLALALLLTSCFGGVEGKLDGPARDLRGSNDGNLPADQPVFIGDPVVFAHSSDKLYRIDPDTLEVQLIAPFGWPADKDTMTDLAIDRAGMIIGISYTRAYAVDARTAACTLLAELNGPSFNGLSYLYQERGQNEFLAATTSSGAVHQLDPLTGQTLPFGNFGGPGSSGDLVSVRGLGAFATVRDPRGTTMDSLARIDTQTGKAEVIGNIGFEDVWGLGFWKNRFFGFTRKSEFITIDIQTGQGTRVSTSDVAWWGAGVTTSAPTR